MTCNALGSMRRKDVRVLQQFRLPKELAQWLSKFAKANGKTKTRIIEEAIRSKMVLP